MSIAIAHALLVPPFQSPDEENHFLRAVQLAQGSVVGRPTPDRSNAGAFLPSGAITVVESFRYLAGKPTVRLDRPALSQARSVEWDWKHQQFAGFGNTVIYPPFLYTPAVIGIWIASSISPLALDGLYAARLSNVLAATLISSLAVLICPLAARAYIASVLLLPMTLALFGSCAPDGFGIALVAIVIAIWSRSGASGVGPPIRILGAAILAIVSSAKLPYLPILGITLLRWPQGRVRWRVVGAAALVTLIPLGLAVWLALASKVEFRPDLGVASSAQLRLVLNHPFDFVMVMVRTGYMYGLNYVEQMIGVLGWLDNPLPRIAYPLYAVGLTVGAAGLFICSLREDGRWFERLFIVCILLCTVLALVLILYLNWTPLGAPLVDGIQGRYFLVPILLLALLPGPIEHPASFLVLFSFRIIQGVVLLVGASGLWFVPSAILMRYYG